MAGGAVVIALAPDCSGASFLDYGAWTPAWLWTVSLHQEMPLSIRPGDRRVLLELG